MYVFHLDIRNFVFRGEQLHAHRYSETAGMNIAFYSSAAGDPWSWPKYPSLLHPGLSPNTTAGLSETTKCLQETPTGAQLWNGGGKRKRLHSIPSCIFTQIRRQNTEMHSRITHVHGCSLFAGLSPLPLSCAVDRGNPVICPSNQNMPLSSSLSAFGSWLM